MEKETLKLFTSFDLCVDFPFFFIGVIDMPDAFRRAAICTVAFRLALRALSPEFSSRVRCASALAASRSFVSV